MLRNGPSLSYTAVFTQPSHFNPEATSLLLLSFPGSLPQSAVTDINVHATVELDKQIAALANKSRQEPMHQAVAPVGSAGEGNVLSTSMAADLAQNSANELFRIGNQQRRLPDLGHSGGDKMRLDTLDADTEGLKLGAESRRPLLEESLGAGVRSEQRGRKGTAEGSHGEDEAALAVHHAWSDELGNAESRSAVDGDDSVHLLLGGLDEGHRDRVAQADVVDEDADVEAFDELAEAGVVGVLVLREVHGEDLGRDLRAILGGDIGGEGVQLGLGAGDEDEVVALCGERERELLADAIGGASDEGPRAARSKLGKLEVGVSGSSI